MPVSYVLETGIMHAMPDAAKPDETKKDEPTYPLTTDQAPVVTRHKLGKMEYEAAVGMLPLKDEFGEVEAGVFFISYTRVDTKDQAQRPLMFSFNGGPGSSSVWLHLGMVGPKRVKLEEGGFMPSPPYELIDNPESWLEHTDLVFIDPVGTGFSRPAKKDGGKKYWSLDGDIQSVGEFIRLYLSRFHRWRSPVYLVGESYGTTRASGLAGDLIGKGIAFKGLVLVSSILNFQTARFSKGNDLPYPLFLPTYTATAWYHKQLPWFGSLTDALMESEAFAAKDYVLALNQGDQLSAADRTKAVKKLVRLTGLSADYVEAADLRINIHRFCKELLRGSKRTVGRIDSRYVGIDFLATSEAPEHDPSISSTLPPYTAMVNDHLRRTLGYETDAPYYVFNPGELWKNWSYGDAAAGHPDTSESLRAALSKNPSMKVFIASGYYDLATPYFATEHTVAHLGLDPSLRGNILTKYYEAGHMMYVDEACLKSMKTDISSFLAG